MNAVYGRCTWHIQWNMVVFYFLSSLQILHVRPLGCRRSAGCSYCLLLLHQQWSKFYIAFVSGVPLAETGILVGLLPIVVCVCVLLVIVVSSSGPFSRLSLVSVCCCLSFQLDQEACNYSAC